MSEILFDSDRILRKPSFSYDKLEIDKLDEYAYIFSSFIKILLSQRLKQTLRDLDYVIEINRVDKIFRALIIKDNDVPVHELISTHYQNNNIKIVENFQYILNDHFGLSNFDLRIPLYPTSSADGYYQWYLLKNVMDYMRIINEKISDLYREYFGNWIFYEIKRDIERLNDGNYTYVSTW